MPDLTASRAGRLLGCRLPIVLAGMGGVARSELAAAVAAAGGFGFLGMVREPPELIAREVERVRALGATHFGVNIIPASTPPDLLERQVQTIIDLGVPVVGLFWDIDAALVRRFIDAGIVVTYQVGSVAEAKAAADAGAAIIIAQGVEAGGHVRGKVPLRQLLPDVVATVDVPVLAAGGLAGGGDLVTARALGADGIVLGTALMATKEAFAHAFHKQALLGKGAADTVLTTDFHINWPRDAHVRVLKTEVTEGGRGSPDAPERIVIGDEEGRPIYLFSTDSPLRSMTGDFGAMALYAGTGVGRIKAIVPAAERLAAVMAEAEGLLPASSSAPASESASAVCYAGEMSGAYMGHIEGDELARARQALSSTLNAALRAVLARQDTGEQPGFPDAAYPYAGWALALAAGPPDAVEGDLPQLQLSLLRQVGALVPRLPEGGTRSRLQKLLGFLQEQQIAAFQRA
jgi:nitronate monooxygenase